MSEMPENPPVPWPYIVASKPDGTLIYYTEQSHSCLPSARALVRRTYTPPNPTPYIDQPTKDLTDAKILLVVNPAAGRGKTTTRTRATALQTVSEILQENGAMAVVRTTERPGHVLDIMKEIGYAGLCDFSAVLSVGGDGTMHEVVSAMVEVCSAQNSDWSKLPAIAVMPCGSGNAIAVSTGITSAVRAALNIVQALRTDSAKPLALMQYRAAPSSSPRDLVSVAGLQWGLPAEVDFGTEHLRWMGDTRYDVGAIHNIVTKKSFSARISITVHAEKNRELWEELQQHYSKNNAKRERDMTEALEYVGDDTYVIDSHFTLGVAWNSSKIADGFMLTPFAKPTETGVFDFIVVRGDLSRRERINIMTRVSNGDFLGISDGYHMFKATKVVFDKINGRYLSIDGELVSMEPFVFEMAPEDGKLRFLDSFSEP